MGRFQVLQYKTATPILGQSKGLVRILIQNLGPMFRVKTHNQNSGSEFRVKIQGRDSGSEFRVRIQGRDSGFRVRIQGRDSGFRVRIQGWDTRSGFMIKNKGQHLGSAFRDRI